MNLLHDVEAAYERVEAYAHDRQAPWIEHDAVPSLVAIARAAQAFFDLATRTGYLVGPIEYVDLAEALAALREPAGRERRGGGS